MKQIVLTNVAVLEDGSIEGIDLKEVLLKVAESKTRANITILFEQLESNKVEITEPKVGE